MKKPRRLYGAVLVVFWLELNSVVAGERIMMVVLAGGYFNRYCARQPFIVNIFNWKCVACAIFMEMLAMQTLHIP